MIGTGDLGRSIKVRVIGQGTVLPRANGLMVRLYNTNVMLASALPAVVAKLHPDAFNAIADAPDATEQSVIDYLRSVQNEGNLPFSVPVTNSNAAQVGQGAIVDCSVVIIKLRDQSEGLGLNFNRVIPAENGTSAASAFDQLMAGTGIGASTTTVEDPFAAAPPAAGKKAAATA